MNIFLMILVSLFELIVHAREHPTLLLSTCPEDYSPCNCTQQGPQQKDVICDKVNAADVKFAFSQTPPSNISTFTWVIPPDEPVPTNIFNDKNVQVVDLVCFYSVNKTWTIEIDSEAFVASKNSLRKLSIASCDISELAFDFLSNLITLTEFKLGPDVMSITNFFKNLGNAKLPALSKLTLERCEGFKGLTNDNLTPANLTSLREFFLTKATDLEDDSLLGVLDWLVSSAAGNVLENLNLDDNGLDTFTYDVVSAFSKIRFFSFRDNRLSTLQEHFFVLYNTNVVDLGLSYNNISQTDVGAFQGDFSRVAVRLNYNKLTGLPPTNFKWMLEQMTTGSGYLYLEKNPINCDGCDLAWLIRDNRKLLERIVKGSCSNNTLLTSLNPDAYADCEVLTEPATMPTESATTQSTTSISSTQTTIPFTTAFQSTTLQPITDPVTDKTTISPSSASKPSTTLITTTTATTHLITSTTEKPNGGVTCQPSSSRQLLLFFWLTLMHIPLLDFVFHK